MDQHMANYSRAKHTPVAKARVVVVEKATPVPMNDPNKEESLPILKTMYEDENGIAMTSTAAANREPIDVEATEATIV